MSIKIWAYFMFKPRYNWLNQINVVYFYYIHIYLIADFGIYLKINN